MSRLSEREFREWQAFWQIHPFGQDIEDGRFSRMMSLFANTKIGKGKRTTPNDFTLPNYKREARQPAMKVGDALKAQLGIS